MPIRQTDSTHEADQAQPLPPDDPRGQTESPSADRMQGADGPPPADEKLLKAGADMIDAEDNAYKGGDQDIDTAGTDADDESPTKALGTGIATPHSRG